MNDHTSEPASLLDGLMEAEVESVVFVRNYVELTLYLADCSPRLSLFVYPTIRSVDGLWRSFGDAGYRDELCRLIDRLVVRTDERSESGLVITFDSGHVLAVRPAWSDVGGPEIGTLQMNDDAQRWMVWRLGEMPFEHDSWA